MPKPTPAPDAAPCSPSVLQNRQLAEAGAAVQTLPHKSPRTFPAAEKLRILAKAEACLASGTRGALAAMLREEGIYSSLLSTWRVSLGRHGSQGLAAKKTGRKPQLDDHQRQVAELTRRNAELERKLHVASVLLELQKKAHELLGLTLPQSNGEP